MTPKTRSTLLLAALAILLVVGWSWPVFFPLRLLVVLFHEMGHAAVAVLTGGQVVEIGLSPLEGGHALTAGGWHFLILNGGYLGSLVAGLLILALSRRPRAARGLTASLGFLVLVVTLWYIRPLVSFGFLYGLLAAGALVGLGVKAPDNVNWGFLRLLGLLSVFYALLDVRSDVLTTRETGPTDASMLAEVTGIPGILWGLAWICTGVVLVWFFRKRLV